MPFSGIEELGGILNRSVKDKYKIRKRNSGHKGKQNDLCQGNLQVKHQLLRYGRYFPYLPKIDDI